MTLLALLNETCNVLRSCDKKCTIIWNGYYCLMHTFIFYRDSRQYSRLVAKHTLSGPCLLPLVCDMSWSWIWLLIQFLLFFSKRSLVTHSDVHNLCFQLQATAEQIRLAQMIYDKNDADFEDKVKQVCKALFHQSKVMFKLLLTPVMFIFAHSS